MLAKIKYKTVKNATKINGKIIRNFFIFNRLRNGVRITKIKPAKLLIKNLG